MDVCPSDKAVTNRDNSYARRLARVWALLAEVATPDQLARIERYLLGEEGVLTVGADEPAAG